MNLRRITATLGIMLLAASTLLAQGGTGQISGTVTDPNGAVVRGAAVKATNTDTNFTRDTVTNDDGTFSFSLLPAGSYSVEITSSGFATTTLKAVVNVSQSTAVNAEMSVSGGNTIVDVAAPALQIETSQNGRTLTGETIRQLPLPSRNFQQLLALSAGAQTSVTNSTDLGRGDANISVNGQRTTSNNVKINGIDANSVGTNSTPNIAVPATDSLQEFIVQTSLYDASYGRNAGGSIEAITRSGGNDFHGNAYEFLRNRSLNASDPFLRARGIAKPVATRNQFGGTLGGPIVKDRVFFFGSYQGTRETNGVSLTNSLTSPIVPAGLRDDNRSAAGLAATFGIPVANINPVAVAILNAKLPTGAFAVPSSGQSAAAPAFNSVTVPQSGESTFKEDQFNANGDFVFTSRHSLGAKFFVAENPTFQANYNFAGLGNGERQLVGFGGDLEIKQRLYSVTDTYVLSPSMVNQARYGYNRLKVTSVPQEPFTAASLGITSPLAAIYPGAPTIRVLGESNFFFGAAPLADQSSEITAHTFGDTLSWTAGNHRVRIGGEYRASSINFYFNAFSRGQINFPNFATFLQGGGIFTTTSLLGSGVFDRSFRVKDVNFWVQDDWKVSNRLTLNLGLRYDYYGLPVDSKGRLVNFLPDSAVVGTTAAPAAPPNGFVQAAGGSLAGVPQGPKTLVEDDRNNIAPRIGLAYQLSEKYGMVIRGGYGLYYDRFSTRFANSQLFNYPYFALGVGLPGFGQTFANPFVNIPPPSSFPLVSNIPSPISGIANPLIGVPIAGVYVDPKLSTPFVHQFNAGFQWEIGHNFVIDAGYVGNRGRSLFQLATLNQPFYNPATNSMVTRFPTTAISANKNATGGVQQVQTSGESQYDSLQVSVSKRYASGLQFLAAYTYGESYDFYSGTGVNELQNVSGDQVNFRSNWGRSDFNREHRFVLSGVYALPNRNYDNGFAKGLLNNWQIATIMVFQSGLPFSIVSENGAQTIQRANTNLLFFGDVYTTGSASSRVNGYFNPAAFVSSCPTAACSAGASPVTNPAFDRNAPFGNTPRNFLTGPGQKNVDISFIKIIPITERVRTEFRTELFNAFNWVNYANPNNNLVGTNFGKIDRAATGPRVIQFGFKVSF